MTAFVQKINSSFEVHVTFFSSFCTSRKYESFFFSVIVDIVCLLLNNRRRDFPSGAKRLHSGSGSRPAWRFTSNPYAIQSIGSLRTLAAWVATGAPNSSAEGFEPPTGDFGDRCSTS